MTTLDAVIFVGLLAIIDRKRRRAVIVDALLISSAFAIFSTFRG
ncbi:MAG: hypothetical protein ABSF97_15915 [Candidatus Sulfotelmatobacter sp.]|jgi:hypothetical protein